MKAILASLVLVLAVQESAPAPKVDFVRDVQPIFKASCIECHGEKKPKAAFRLDSKAHALKGGIGGKSILPGKGAESPLIKLLLSTDADERMPRKAAPLQPLITLKGGGESLITIARFLRDF